MSGIAAVESIWCVVSAGYRTQIRKLKAEGINVKNGRVRLPECQWAPDLDELIWGPP